MLEGEALESGKLAVGEGAAAAGMDHAGAGGGHAACEMVAVCGGAVVESGGVDVVVWPVGWDRVDDIVDGCVWLATGRKRFGGVRGFGEFG